MTNARHDPSLCSHCSETVQADDDFCPHCGEIFASDVSCRMHSAQKANGVCIICAEPFCADCGARVHDRFLCNPHSGYEIYQGMARVYGSSDPAQVGLAQSFLEKEGLHPFVFSRKASPISLGGPDHTLFRASGEYDGHIVNEFKLMVLCQEVEKAEKKLKELDFIQEP